MSTFPLTVTAVTAWPTKDPADPTFGGTTFRTQAGNAVELAGKCTAGSGRLYLLRWDEDAPGAGAAKGWRAVELNADDQDSIPVDTTKPANAAAGQFSQTYLTGESGLAWYCVLAVGGPTLDPLRAYQRRL